MRADLLALIVPVPGTVTKNKRDIMKTIFEHMLAEDTRTNETSVVRMSEIGIKCGSGRKRYKRGQIWHVYNPQVTGTITIYTLQLFLGETVQL